MGNVAAKRRTPAAKAEAAAAQDEARGRAQANVAALRAAVVSSVGPSALVAGSAGVAVLAAAAVADTQLARQGGELTKADLVAVVLALQPDLVAKAERVAGLTCSDLRAKIRSVVFDPARHVQRPAIEPAHRATEPVELVMVDDAPPIDSAPPPRPASSQNSSMALAPRVAPLARDLVAVRKRDAVANSTFRGVADLFA